MTDFTMKTDADGVAIITWDVPGKSMNVMSIEGLSELDAIIDTVLSDDSIKGAVVTSGKDGSFAGGMDLNLLAKMREDAGDDPAKGLFEGTQSHLDFLPESHTDFIIAVLAEELGFLGVLLLLGLYFLLITRGLIIAIGAQGSFARMLAGGLTITFFTYLFVNIAMVSGLLPVVGVPLPLVSYGGTSALTLMAGFGILMSIQTHRNLIHA
jgi:hypothetical protein